MLDKQTSRLTPDEIERYAHLFDERAIYEEDNKVSYRNGEIYGCKERKQETQNQFLIQMIENGFTEEVR